MSLLKRNLEAASATLQSLFVLESRLDEAAEIVVNAFGAGKKLLACGNGGSAADAMHLATELVVRFEKERRPYPALSLATSGADLTAIANDYSFADVFARQVEALGQRGDVLVGITTSGRSENVRRALEVAARKGLKTIAFLGRDGGPTRGIANVELLVPSLVTARIQEAHKVLIHTLCEGIEKRLGI